MFEEEGTGEPGKSGGFWARVKANRHAFESVLFEHKALNIKEKTWIGITGALVLWLMSVIFLFEWLQVKSPLLPQSEAQTFAAVSHYISAFGDQGIWTILKPDINSLRYSPPFYYLLYVPVFKFITSDLKTAMLIIHSVFLLIISLMPCIAMTKVRGWAGGLLASAALLACPFITEAARVPSPSIAVIALTVGLYCSFLCYKELVDNNWSYWFAGFFVIGCYTSVSFWVYSFPLLMQLFVGTFNFVNGGKFLNVILPGILINIIWYLFLILFVIFGFIAVRESYQGIFTLLTGALPGLGLLVLIIGGIALPWMYISSYKPYEKRKDIMRLFLVPWFIFSFILCLHDPKLLYPAFVSLPLAIAVMTPFRAEKYLSGIFVLLFIANNLSSPVKLGKIPLYGCERTPAFALPHESILKYMSEILPEGKSKVAVYSTDGSLNAESFNFIFNKGKYEALFINDPLLPDFSSVVINKTAQDGSNSAGFEKLRAEEGFSSLFSKKFEIPVSDGSKVEIYAKNNKPFGVFPAGKYPLGTLSFGPFIARQVTLGVESYDNVSGSYSGYVFIPASTLYSGDIYGLRMDISGLKFSDVNSSPALSDISTVRISSARLSSYTVESVLRNHFDFINDLAVAMEEDRLSISGEISGHRMAIDFAVAVPRPGVIEVRPVSVSFMGINVPEGMKFLLRVFSYRFNLSENPYGLSMGSISMANGIMEIK